MKREFLLKYGMWLLLLMGLSPFFILAWYNWPASDDYFDWMYVQDNGHWGAFRNYYLNWGGRFSSYALVELLNPLQWGENSSLRWITFLQLGLFLFLGVSTSKMILPATVSGKYAFYGSACILLFWWLYLPRPVELLYWFTGSMTYLPGLLGISSWYHLSRKDSDRNRLQQICFGLLPMFIAGTNELNILLLGILMSWEIFQSKEYRRSYIIPSILYVAASAIALFAPGNTSRSAFFEVAAGLPVKDIGFTLRQSAILGIESLSRLLFKTPVLLVACVIGCIHPSKKLSPLIVSALFLGLLLIPMLLYAPFCFGTGQQVAPDRLNNVVFLVASFFVMRIASALIRTDRFINYTPTAAFVTALFCIVLPGNRAHSAWIDVGKAPSYLKQHQHRVSFMEESKEKYDAIMFRFGIFKSPPYTIFYGDLSQQSEDHFNQGYARYHQVKAVCVDENKP